jgi:hypothetical protein
MQIKRVMTDSTGTIVISVLLGLGLAAMFRKVCKDGSCIVIKAPKMEEVGKYYYKIEEDCYKYTPRVVDCPSKGVIKE